MLAILAATAMIATSTSAGADGIPATTSRSAILQFAEAIGITGSHLSTGDIVQYSYPLGDGRVDCTAIEVNGLSGFAFTSSDSKLLELCIGPLPHVAGLPGCEAVARNCVGKERELGEPQLIYAGTSIYLVRFPVLVSGVRIMELTLDLRTRQVVDGQWLPDSGQAKPSGGTAQSEPVPALGTPHEATSLSLSKTEHRLLQGVPRLRFHISDGATSAAAILAYWERKQNISLRRTSLLRPGETETDDEFISQFKSAGCGCNLGRTLQEFAALRGYNLKAEYRKLPVGSSEQPVSFDWHRLEIDAGHPVLVVLASNGLRHTILGVGYAANPAGSFLAAVDQGLPSHTPTDSQICYYRWDGLHSSIEITSVSQLAKRQ